MGSLIAQCAVDIGSSGAVDSLTAFAEGTAQFVFTTSLFAMAGYGTLPSYYKGARFAYQGAKAAQKRQNLLL